MSSLASNFLRLTSLRLPCLLALFSFSASVPGCCCLRHSSTKLLNADGGWRILAVGDRMDFMEGKGRSGDEEKWTICTRRDRNTALADKHRSGEREKSFWLLHNSHSPDWTGAQKLAKSSTSIKALLYNQRLLSCLILLAIARFGRVHSTSIDWKAKRGSTLSNGRCNVMPFGSSEKLSSSSPSVVYSNNCDNAAHWTSIDDGLSDRSSPN